MPANLGRVLRLVRRLIDYGKQLAATVQERVATPAFDYLARPFGTADLAVILVRITNGLRRAAALEARLCARAARGGDLTVVPIRLPASRPPRGARRAAPPPPQPATVQAEDPSLTRLLTEEEIATEVRRRPIGAVIVDICCDLGIAPGDLDKAFWREISLAVISYDGNMVRLFRDVRRRLSASFRAAAPSGDGWPPWPPPPPRRPAPTGTGPPP